MCMMAGTFGPSCFQTIFSRTTYKSFGYFNLKFPGLALAWLTITASTLVRIIFVPSLIHNAADISELITDLQHNRIIKRLSNHFLLAVYFLSLAIGLYGVAKVSFSHRFNSLCVCSERTYPIGSCGTAVSLKCPF